MPDCTNTGLTEGKHCDVCGEVLVAQEVVDALGHKYDAEVTAPTCVDKGYTTYTCSVCGDTYVADYVDALGHTESEAVIENEVTPDCVNTGSYDTVVYCTVCDEELNRETITVDALGHKDGDVAVENEVAPNCVNDGSYDTVVYCTVCGEELNRETITVDALGHTDGDVVVENNVAPDCVNTGSYDTVVYCTVCGEELSRETITVDALGHTDGDVVVENVVDADCVNNGSYDNVVYCTVCGEELTRETIVVDALGHTESEAVVENNVEPDCVNDGKYDTVVYCSVCDAEVSRIETIVPALGHIEGEAIVENNVAPDCVNNGSYDNVVYCTVCNKELNRDTIVVDALGHTEGEPTEENRVEADCLNDGSFDTVVYCTVCGEEISRETTVLEKGHKTVKTEAVDPTCTLSGNIEFYTCTVCDRLFADEECTEEIFETEVVPLGHTPSDEWIVTEEPTEMTKGTETNYCDVCGEELESRDVEPLGGTVWGTVTSFNSETEEITVELIGDSEEVIATTTVTGNNAEYSFGQVQAGTYVIRVSKKDHVTREYTVVIDEAETEIDVKIHLLGDIDGNGKINILDYSSVLKHVKKTQMLEGYAFECGDIDSNGVLNILDYGKILRHVKKVQMLWTEG